MTNTETNKRARAVVDLIAADLNEDLIRRRFDNPVEEVLRQLRYEADYPVDHKAFNRVMAQVLEQVCGGGLRIPTALLDPMAEAIVILEEGYQSGTYGPGYVAALLDANHEGEEGLHTVMTSLGELIKEREKGRYIRSVFATHLPTRDWNLRCEIVRVLLEDYRAVMPAALGGCAPAQFVDQIPSLMCTCLRADSAVRDICVGAGTAATETAAREEPLWL